MFLEQSQWSQESWVLVHLSNLLCDLEQVISLWVSTLLSVEWGRYQRSHPMVL